MINAYFEVGKDKYMLCARALERLRNEGYIILVNSCVGTGGVSVNLGPDDAYRQLLDALESRR